MKHILIGLLSLIWVNGYNQVNVLNDTIDCHAGMIFLTIEDTSNSSYTLTLEYYDAGWNYLTSEAILSHPDTFEVTFSGIGTAIHSYLDFRVLADFDSLISLQSHCIGVGIDENDTNEPIFKIEYYNLAGQIVEDPTGLYIEVITYESRKQSIRKVFKGTGY